MLWRDYDLHMDKDLDLWVLPSYDTNVQLINRFAFFDEPVSEQFNWYLNNPNEGSNIADFFKVVEIGEETIAFFILNYYTDEKERFVVGINPIVVHPKKINKGYGQKVLREFMENVETIVKGKVDVIYAGIDRKNISSTKIFTKAGFKEVGNAPDDEDFIYYEFHFTESL